MMISIHSRKDISSGILVAILAIPLSMGISIASSFPVEAGLITAIVLGITASFFGSQKQSIKGPAAGLISIMTAGMFDFAQQGFSSVDSYRCMLVAGLICGCLQIIAGKKQWTKHLQFVPPSILHGLLAGIGGIIFIKQFPLLIGSQIKSTDALEFTNQFSKIILDANLLSCCIGLLAIAILALPEIFTQTWLKKTNLSPPLFLFLITVIASFYFDFVTPREINFGSSFSFSITPHLHVPISESLFTNLSTPKLNSFVNFSVWKWGFILFLIGTIESTMTLAALQSTPSNKTKEDIDADKDLFSLGVGNIFSSICGGLPGISEVARTKANLEYGATSKLSLFAHSVFIATACLFGSTLLMKMPMPILSSMLILVAYKLISPKTIYESYEEGWDQLALYLTAMLLTLFTDLMIALIASLIFKITIHLFRGIKISEFFQSHYELEIDPNGNAVVTVKGSLIFCNVSNFLSSLDKLVKEFPTVFIDLSHSKWVDHTASQKIKNKTVITENLEILKN